MKRVIIVHRWDGTPNSDWYPWLKKELEKKDFEVLVPSMPNTSEPKIKDWVSHLKKVVGKPDNETYFVAHSIGCQTVMRYLEKENYNGKVGKVIFIAGWFNLENLEDEEVEKIAHPWLTTPINFSRVKEKINDIKVFLSTNDPFGCLEENKTKFENKLNAKVIILKNKGHFTSDDGVEEFPKILKEISK